MTLLFSSKRKVCNTLFVGICGLYCGNPRRLEWEHDDLSEKTFSINTYSNQDWTIEEV